MPKQVYISIDTPCHEDWNNMSPTAQGAFCKSCNKHVIDFTRKTENEIYDIVTQPGANVCGRFTQFQLEQPVRRTEVKNGLMNWRAIAASLAAIASVAEVKVAKAQDSHYIKPSTCPDKVAGDTTDRKIRGVVIDVATKEPMAEVVVRISNTMIGAVTDKDGKFCIDVDWNNYLSSNVVLNYLGFEKQSHSVAGFVSDTINLFELKEENREIDLIVVTGGYSYTIVPEKTCKKKKK